MTWKAAALEHAKSEAPQEACGLLVRKGRRKVYVPCRNISPMPLESFLICPDDWAEAEDQYDEILAVIHSHPGVDPQPSEADQRFCNETDLPWHIVNPETAVWADCTPLKC